MAPEIVENFVPERRLLQSADIFLGTESRLERYAWFRRDFR
jgi:hypothetical protein